MYLEQLNVHIPDTYLYRWHVSGITFIRYPHSLNIRKSLGANKGNNKITEHWAIFQRVRQTANFDNHVYGPVA
jgi:hypothetical protein